MAEKNLILTQQQVKQLTKRIAYEVVEQNFKEKEIVLAGIYDKGYAFAKLLQKELKAISAMEVVLVKVTLDKLAPSQSEVSLDTEVNSLKNKVIVVVDDVLNTGRTVAYALKPFLNIKVKQIQTAFVVDRGYHSFPISADYVGLALATTLKEHIEVVLDKKKMGVYIS